MIPPLHFLVNIKFDCSAHHIICCFGFQVLQLCLECFFNLGLLFWHEFVGQLDLRLLPLIVIWFRGFSKIFL
jgi:hypothetical protein